MTTRHVQVRLVRVGAAIPPLSAGKPQELDYRGHSIAASVGVTGGGNVTRTEFIRKFQDPYSPSRCMEERSWLVAWNVGFSSILTFQVI